MIPPGDSDDPSLRDIEQALVDLARKPPKDRDQRFWSNFSRSVRLAYLAASARRNFWRRLFPVALGLAFAAVALVVFIHRRPPAHTVTVDHNEGMFEDADPDELIEALDSEGLQKLAAALDKEKT